MENLIERLRKGEILVSDGGMGTILMERGLKPDEPPESFNLTHLEVVEEISRLYLDAGADILHTNTFGASPLKLSLYSLDDKTEEINTQAISAASKVVGDRAYLSASCGPSGKILEPYGDTSSSEMYDNFERQLNAITSIGVDIICIETMTDLREANLAIKAAKNISPSIPIMATMTFNPTPRGFYTIMGVSIEEAVSGLEDEGADIIGSNCGNGIENMIEIAREFKKYSHLPILIQPNAGIPDIKGNNFVYPETPEFMAEKAMKLIPLGVSIIGGCCGTTHEHISAIRKVVDSYR